MEFWTHIIAIIGLTLLCIGWLGVQWLAHYMKTKNHFECDTPGCGHCEKMDHHQRCPERKQ